MRNNRYLPNTQKILKTSIDGPEVLKIRTDTIITNSNLFITPDQILKHTPLTNQEIHQLLADTPEEKLIFDNGEILVRISEVIKYNDPKIRDPDPHIREQARTFEDAIVSVNIKSELVNERAIASETVLDKSNKAKHTYRHERKKQGLGTICEESQNNISPEEQIHIHHDPRVADYPELAAEEESLNAIGSNLHKSKHKKDKQPL